MKYYKSEKATNFVAFSDLKQNLFLTSGSKKVILVIYTTVVIL